MALNNLGMGFVISARDRASGVLRRIGNRFTALSGTTKMALGAIAVAGAGVVAGLGVMSVGTRILHGVFDGAHEAATKFATAIAEVETLLDPAARNTEEMRNQVLGLVQTFGGAPEEQARALYQTISAGITDTAEATRFLDVANRLAVGGVTDVTTAVDGLSTVVNAYGLNAGEAENISDQLFTTVRLGKTTVPELSNSIGRVAASARNAGLETGELFASIATLTQGGLQTSRAVTGLNGALAGIIRPTRAAQEEAERLGIAFNSDALRENGLQGLLQSIQGSEGFNATTFERLFGSVEGLNAVVALAADDGARFADTLEQMGGAAGATAEAFDRMRNTTAFVMQRLTGAFDVFKTRAGEILERLLMPFIQGLNFLLDAFESLPPGVQTAIIGTVALIGVFIAAAGAAMAFGIALMFLAPLLLPLAIIAAVVAAAFLFILLPAIAIAALTIFGFMAAFEDNVGGIAGSTGNLIDKIKLFFSGLSQVFSDGFLSGDTAEQLLQEENRGVFRVLLNVVAFIERVKAFFAGLKEGFRSFVRAMGPSFEALQDAFSELGGALGFVSDSLEDASGAPLEGFSRSGARVGQMLGAAFKMIVQAITGGIRLWTAFIDIVKSGQATLRRISAQIALYFGFMSDGIRDSFDSVIQAMGELAAKVPEEIRPDFLQTMVDQGARSESAIGARGILARGRAAEFRDSALAESEMERRTSRSIAAVMGSPIQGTAAQEASARAQRQDASIAASAEQFAALVNDRPIDVRTTIQIDGDTLATTVDRVTRSAGASAFSPVPDGG